MWSKYITYTEKRRGNLFRVLSFAFAPLAPHIAYRLATPRQEVYYIAVIYDITTGKPIYAQRTQMSNQKPTKSRLRLHVFDLMRQLSKPKKNKS
jgi:fructose-1,6-bisphosphatase/inositol monophosphatase family enzyme